MKPPLSGLAKQVHPADAVRLVYAIDVRSLELLNALKDRLPPDSSVWRDVEELERSIDSRLTTAIPVETAAEVTRLE